MTAATGGRIAVAVPLFNGAASVGDTLRSLVEQDDDRWEAWIVDDASTDDSVDVVAPFLADERFHLVRNPRNLGMAANWNAATQLAKGELVMTLGHDDWLVPDAFSIVRRHFDQVPDAGYVAFGGMTEVGGVCQFGPRHVLGVLEPSDVLRLEVELEDNPPPSEVVYRGSVLDEVGLYDETFRYCPEVDLQIRIALAGHPAVHLAEPLAHRGEGAKRVTSKLQHSAVRLDDYYELALRYGARRVDPTISLRSRLRRRGVRSAVRQARRRDPRAAYEVVRAVARGDRALARAAVDRGVGR